MNPRADDGIGDDRKQSDRQQSDPKQSLLAALRAALGDRVIDRWLDGGAAVRVEGETLCVESVSAFVRDARRARFDEPLTRVARALFGDGAKVEHRLVARASKASCFDSTPGDSTPGDSTPGGSTPAGSKTLETRADANSAAAPNGTSSPTGRSPTVRARSMSGKHGHESSSPLLGGPTLDDFVVGNSNRFAYDGAVRMARPDGGPRTLFIHGTCGVGKTHLLRGIAARRMQHARNQQVLYTTGEAFTNEFIAALKSHSLEAFRRRIRSYALLAIDDVHFLADKQRTTSEFLHTVDAIGLDGSQVVLASDAPLDRIRAFSQALISRLKAGVVVQIDLPDPSLRAALLDRMLLRRGLQLTPEARRRFVSRIVGTARDIEGALHRVELQWRLGPGSLRRDARADGTGGDSSAHSASDSSSHSSSHSSSQGASDPPGDAAREEGPIDLATVDAALRDLVVEHIEPVRPAAIVSTVCALLSVERQELLGKSRHPRTVLARTLTAWLCRDLTSLSFPEIAALLGRRNHSTIHAATTRMAKLVEANTPITDVHALGTMGAADLAEHARRLARR